MSIRSILEVTQQSSNVQDIEEQLILRHSYGFRKLNYDLMYLNRTSNNQLDDIICAMSYGQRKMESDRVVYWRKGGLGIGERAEYCLQLMNHMGDWGYSKITYKIDDDDFTPEIEEQVDEDTMSWMNLVELIVHSDYFDTLYRFVDRIQHDDLDVIGIELYKTKVIINYGKCSYCRS